MAANDGDPSCSLIGQVVAPGDVALHLKPPAKVVRVGSGLRQAEAMTHQLQTATVPIHGTTHGPSMEERFLGCILAGAAGDNLGSVIEFRDAAPIFTKFGPYGARDVETCNGVYGAVTDDTQMSLFTAEGLIVAMRTHTTALFKAESAVPALHQSYLRWLATQGESSKSLLFAKVKDVGWLRQVKQLEWQRAPGFTCLGALASGRVGSEDAPINDSKGCGGVMRTAPCALAVHAAFPHLPQEEKADLAYDLACKAAAITHGHVSGYISAGCLAAVIAHILSGETLGAAIARACALARARHGEKSAETVAAIESSVASATLFNGLSFVGKPVGALEQEVVTHVEALGGGWVGEEALAIAIFCCLISPGNVEDALRFAVNHSGDSDSTGAIAGNIIGVMLGHLAIPRRFRDGLEIADVLCTVARDLVNLGNPAAQNADMEARIPSPRKDGRPPGFGGPYPEVASLPEAAAQPYVPPALRKPPP